MKGIIFFSREKKCYSLLSFRFLSLFSLLFSFLFLFFFYCSFLSIFVLYLFFSLSHFHLSFFLFHFLFLLGGKGMRMNEGERKRGSEIEWNNPNFIASTISMMVIIILSSSSFPFNLLRLHFLSFSLSSSIFSLFFLTFFYLSLSIQYFLLCFLIQSSFPSLISNSIFYDIISHFLFSCIYTFLPSFRSYVHLFLSLLFLFPSLPSLSLFLKKVFPSSPFLTRHSSSL